MNSRKMFGRLVAAVVLVAVLCASCVTTVPMTDGEPVDVEKIFMGSAYYQEEANLAPNTVAEVLESYEETESYVQSYKLRRIGYSVFSGIGSIMMIGAAVTNITGSYFTGAGLALGAAVMYGVALPFSASSYNALDDGVDVYNTDVVGAD